MYHIKNDKRTQRSAQIIASALYEICATKPLREITVSDIHKTCGISRATVYRLFDSVEDVLQFLCDQAAGKLINALEKKSVFTVLVCLNAMIQLSMENEALLEILVRNQRMDTLLLAYGYAFRSFIERIPEFQSEECAIAEYRIASVLALTSGVLSTWIGRGKKESAEEMEFILRQFTLF